ncbi:MAG: hypothetical protein ACFFFH_20515, partial [Candidatus Thorarchaeota archaeon]
MNKKSSVLYGLEEKQKQLIAEVQQGLDTTLKKLEDDFKRQREALIEASNQTSDYEIIQIIKNTLAEKRLEVRHETNLKKIKLINEILNTFRGLHNNIQSKDYENFFRQSLKAISHKYIKSGDSVIIHVLPKDKRLINLNTVKVSISDDLDPNGLGGYLIEIPNRKIVINNTLANCIEKSKRNLQMELGSILFSSIPQPEWDEDQIIS